MIQLAEAIEYLDTRKVPLNPKWKRIFVGVASNPLIDIAVVGAKQLNEFDESETGDDVDIDWVENIRNYEFEYELPGDLKRRFLLFWNANDEDEAIVAYKITPLGEPRARRTPACEGSRDGPRTRPDPS